MIKYNLVSENSESTVVTEYHPLIRTEITYQTEADLERAFIAQLQAQAYEYLPLKSENDLIANLRRQLELLNDYRFSDSEWDQFFNSKIANRNYGIEEKTAIIQEDYIQLLTRDDGTVKNIYLIDKANIHNNRLQVINQYTVNPNHGNQVNPENHGSDSVHPNRYDVTILVNGLPLVHVELKKRGVHLKEAFNQIERYSRESFWSGTGLFEYVQLFVISNGTYTKYYSNTTRYTHIKEREGKPAVTGKRTSHSFEFTSWWADAANRPITDLMDFTRTFFAKHTLLNMLTKYCVFTSEKLLLAMRPYQIVATERILGKINVANNYKIFNSPRAGGYIWHTTGSGKTLTSFKTALLASNLPYIDKVLFVVDRKDLDYQTMKEYDRFQKGAANSNTSTAILKKQLEDPNCRIIITTIQKLAILIKQNKKNKWNKKGEIPAVGRNNDAQCMNEQIPPSSRNDNAISDKIPPCGRNDNAMGEQIPPVRRNNDAQSMNGEIPPFSRNDSSPCGEMSEGSGGFASTSFTTLNEPPVIPSEARNLSTCDNGVIPNETQCSEEPPFSSRPHVIPSEARNLNNEPHVISSEARNLNNEPSVIPSEARNLYSQSAVVIPSEARNLNNEPHVISSEARNPNNEPPVIPSEARNLSTCDNVVIPNETQCSEEPPFSCQPHVIPSEARNLYSQSAVVIPSEARNLNNEPSVIPNEVRNLNNETHVISSEARNLSTCDEAVISSEARNLFNQHTVIIFDECHRSQFGEMHAAITKSFKKYHLFGFTGTPILAKNLAGNAIRPDLLTTDQVFGEKLHTYTVVDAIRDKNVLPFRVDYVSTMREQENIADAKVWDIDRERILLAPERIANIVKYILEHFDQKTKRNSFYRLKERRLAGFNSILATASIEAAKRYYAEFKRQMTDLPSDKQLKVALIYSFGVNEDEPEAEGFIDEENPEDTSRLDQSSRDFLEAAILDYNRMFKTNYDTSSEKFQNYYKDVSQRVKDREIDLLIVVNMFLTGFDATTLNTLWVDKNLRMHGLMQAFSRTNRILNSVKTFGNIVCFRNLEEATNESISLFGDKDAAGVVLLKTYDEYYYGYKDNNKEFPGYASLVNELLDKFPVGEPIFEEQRQKDFIRLYGNMLRVKNILSTFDAFEGNEIFSELDMQDYQSMYIDLYEKYREKKKRDVEDVTDDIVFEMELIKQVEINIDYILELIRKYHESNMKDKEIVVSIRKAVDSSMELRNKKDLIEQFIDSMTPSTRVDEDWQAFVDTKKKEELDRIIDEERLSRDETYRFINNAFRDGFIQTTGTALGKVLPPVSRFTPNGERSKKRETVLEKLTAYFKKFWDISGGKLFR